MNKSMIWKLSTGDIAFKYNCDVLATLGSLDEPRAIRELLSSKWNISSERELLQTLQWLENHGHSGIYRQAVAGKATEFQQFFIKEFGERLEGVDLAAWDLGRYASLVRWGYHAGYISEHKVWSLLKSTSRTLQVMYDSWEQFAEHYILGRFFWNGNSDDKQLTSALEYLLENEKSPWRFIPWNTCLDDDDRDWKRANPYYVDLNRAGIDELVIKQGYYKRMMTEDNKNPYVYHAYASFLESKLMDPEQAIRYYRRAILVDKSFIHGYRSILQLIGDNKFRQDQTLEMYEFWIRNMPDCDEAYFRYADWLVYKYGQYDRGGQCYEKAIELNGGEYSYFVDYGFFLADIRHDYDGARQMYLKALEINPQGEQALINLQALREGLEAVVQFTNSSHYSRFVKKNHSPNNKQNSNNEN